MPSSRSTYPDHVIPPPNPLRSWPRRHPWLLWSGVPVLLALVAAGAYWLTRPVLVTDGSPAFAPDLKDVETKIAKENKQATKDKNNYVSIAVMATMKPTSKDPLDEDYAKRALEGAYVAQRENNKDKALQIKLLLADSGSDEKYAKETVEQLEDRVHTDRLVAVTGLGISNDKTWAVKKELTRQKIPAIGADLAGDEYKNSNGFVDIAPRNSGQNRAALAFLVKRRNPSEVQLVMDRNSHDQYSRSLASSFRKVAKEKHIAINPKYFSTSYRNAENRARVLGSRVCDGDSDTVYFAGRSEDFQAFVGGLGGGGCDDKKLWVITGVDAAQLVNNGHDVLKARGVSVYYTGEAFPGALEKYDLEGKGTEGDFIHEYQEYFDVDNVKRLRDGWAIMYHDAVRFAGKAAADAYADSSSKDHPPQAEDVEGALFNTPLEGASGPLCFDPKTKPVPIIHLDWNGHPKLKDVFSTDGKKPPHDHSCPSG